MFDYDIIATGSTGNAVLITVKPVDSAPYKILIDMGISYKRLEKAFNEASFVFISHKHQDHLNKSAYNKLTIEHPRTTVVTNEETSWFITEHNLPEPDVVINADQSFYLGDLKVSVFDNYHGVECNGYIFELNGEVLLYSTDLSTTIDYETYLQYNDLKVDYLLLEGNYDLDIFEFYISTRNESVRDLWSAGSSRHLPIQDWEAFKDTFCHDNSKIEMLHTSSTYGSVEGLLKTINKSRMKDGLPLMEKETYFNWLGERQCKKSN